MSDVNKLFEKLQTMKLSDLLRVCAQALESDLDKQRTTVLFQILQMRVQKKLMAEQLGLKDDTKN